MGVLSAPGSTRLVVCVLSELEEIADGGICK